MRSLGLLKILGWAAEELASSERSHRYLLLSHFVSEALVLSMGPIIENQIWVENVHMGHLFDAHSFHSPSPRHFIHDLSRAVVSAF